MRRHRGARRLRSVCRGDRSALPRGQTSQGQEHRGRGTGPFSTEMSRSVPGLIRAFALRSRHDRLMSVENRPVPLYLCTRRFSSNISTSSTRWPGPRRGLAPARATIDAIADGAVACERRRQSSRRARPPKSGLPSRSVNAHRHRRTRSLARPGVRGRAHARRLRRRPSRRASAPAWRRDATRRLRRPAAASCPRSRATRAASEDDLAAATGRRLAEMLAAGTTTCEAKSGYGLDTETELRMLRVIRRLGRRAADRARGHVHGRARSAVRIQRTAGRVRAARHRRDGACGGAARRMVRRLLRSRVLHARRVARDPRGRPPCRTQAADPRGRAGAERRLAGRGVGGRRVGGPSRPRPTRRHRRRSHAPGSSRRSCPARPSSSSSAASRRPAISLRRACLSPSRRTSIRAAASRRRCPSRWRSAASRWA